MKKTKVDERAELWNQGLDVDEIALSEGIHEHTVSISLSKANCQGKLTRPRNVGVNNKANPHVKKIFNEDVKSHAIDWQKIEPIELNQEVKFEETGKKLVLLTKENHDKLEIISNYTNENIDDIVNKIIKDKL